MARDNEIIECVKVTSSSFTNLGLVIHECSQRTKSDQGTMSTSYRDCIG
jgi:hypothetical protein